MSATIDQKVVEMEFDNEKFESNVKTTMSTLDKLKEKLKFDDIGDGLSGIADSIKNLGKSGSDGLDELGSGLDNLGGKATWLDEVFTGFLRKFGEEVEQVTHKVFDMATSMSQIKTMSQGWERYADKTTAVQTIMAATAYQFDDQGKQLEFVNGELERLNWFTDETSYRFLSMVQSIGKFTAAGVDLGEAVSAMQGIANWAAISGQLPAVADRAYYALSQAMGTGYVSMYNWRSIELANMATQEFKTNVLETANALGVLKKKSEGVWTYSVNGKVKEVTAQNFRSTLSDKWLTREVMVKALQEYGDYTNVLYEAIKEMNESYEGGTLIVSDVLGYLDDYMSGKLAKGTKEYRKALRELNLSGEDFDRIFSKLRADEYELGRKSFKAAQEAKTFQEAIDSVIEASGSKWMQIFEILFGNYLEAKKLWTNLANNLYDVFTEPLNIKIDILKRAFEEPIDALSDTLTAAGVPMDKFMEKAKELGIRSGSLTERMIEDAGSLEETLTEGWLSEEIMAGSIFSNIGIGKIDKAARSLEIFGQKVREVLGATGVLVQDRLKKGQTLDDLIKNGTITSGDLMLVTDAIVSDTDYILGLMADEKKFSAFLTSSGTSLERFNKTLEGLRIASNSNVEALLKSGKKLTDLIKAGLVPKELITKALYSVSGSVTAATKTLEIDRDKYLKVVEDIIAGKYGNGAERIKKLTEEGYDAKTVQGMVNAYLKKGKKGFDEYIDGLSKSNEEYQKVVNEIIRGNYGNGAKRVELLTKAGWDYKTVQAMVNEQLEKGSIDFSKYDIAVSSSTKTIDGNREAILALRKRARTGEGDIAELVEGLSHMSTKEMWVGALQNLMDGLVSWVYVVRDAYGSVFTEIDRANWIKTIIARFYEVTARFAISEEAAERLTGVMTNIFQAFRNIGSIIKRIAQSIVNTIKGPFKDINIDFISILETISEIILKFTEWLMDRHLITDTIKAIGTGFGWVVGKVVDFFTSITSGLGPNGIFGPLKAVGEMLGGVIDGFSSLFSKKVGTETNSVFGVVSKTAEKLEDVGDRLKGVVKGTKEQIKLDWSKVTSPLSLYQEILTYVKNLFPELIQNTREWLDQHSLINDLVNLFKWRFDTIVKAFDFVYGTIKKFFTDEKYKKWLNFIWDSIKIGAAVVTGRGKTVIDYFKTFFSTLRQADTAEAKANVISTALGGAFDFVSGKISDAIKLAKDFFARIKEMRGFSIKDVSDIAGTVLKENSMIGGLTTAVNKAYEEQITSITENYTDQVGILTTAAGVLKKLFGGLIGTLDGAIEKGSLLNNIIVVFAGGALLKMSKGLFSTAKDIGYTVERIVTPVTGVFKQVGDNLSVAIENWGKLGSSLNNVAQSLYTASVLWGFKQIAKAMLAIARSMFIISTLSPEEMTSAGIIIVGFLGLMAAIVNFIATSPKAGGAVNTANTIAMFTSLSVGIIAFGIALSIVGIAIAKYKDSFDTKTLLMIGGALAAIIAIVYGVALISKIIRSKGGDTTTFKIGGAKLLGFAGMIGAAVRAMVALTILVLATKGLTISSAFGAVMILGTAMGALYRLVKLAGKIGGVKARGMVAGMAASLLIIGLALTRFGKIDMASVEKNFYALFTALSIMAVLLVAMASMQKVLTVNLSGAGMAMAGMAVAIYALIGSLILLSKIKDTAGLRKGVAAIAVLMIAMAGFIKLSAFEGTKQLSGAAAMLIAMAISVGTMAFAIAGLSLIPMDKLITGGAVVVRLILALSTIVWASGKISAGGRNLLYLAWVIGTLTMRLGALTMLSDMDKLKAVARSMGLVIGAFALVFRAMGLIVSEEEKISTKFTGKSNDYSKVKGITSSKIFALAAFATVLIAAMGRVILAISKYGNPEGAQKAGQALAMTTAALGVVILAIGVVSRMFAKNTVMGLNVALGDLFKTLAVITVVVTVLAGIISLMTLTDTSKAVPAAEALSLLLITFAGAFAIISVVGKLAPAALTAIAPVAAALIAIAGLAAVVGWLMDTFEGFGPIMEKGLDAMESFFWHIGRMLGGIIGGAIERTSDSLPTAGENLAAFAENAAGFFTALSSVDVEGGNKLEALANIITGSRVLAGTNIEDLKKAGEALLYLGTGMTDYFTSISGLTEDDYKNVETSAIRLKSLAEASNQMGSWSLIGVLFTGAATPRDFADYLPLIGEGLKGFADNLRGGFNAAMVNNATSVLPGLMDGLKSVPKEGGFWDLLAGNVYTTMEHFPQVMSGLADGMVGFGQQIRNMTTVQWSRVKLASENAVAFWSIVDVMYDYRNKLLGFDRSESMKFTMDTYAAGIMSLSNGLEGMTRAKWDRIARVSSISAQFATVFETMTGNIIPTESQSNNFYKAMEAMGSGMVELDKSYESLNVDQTSYGRFMYVLKSMSEMWNSGEIDPNNVTAMANLGQTVIESVAELINDPQLKHFSVWFEEFVKAFQEQFDTVLTTVIEFVPKFTEAGENFVIGFIQGLNNNDRLAEIQAAAILIGTRAVEGLNKGLDAHSPSKETEKSGIFFDLGFIEGIKAKGKQVYETAKAAGENAKEGLFASLKTMVSSKIQEFLDGNMDLNPVISPVLDLSNLQTGTSQISGLLDASNFNLSRTGMNLNGIKTSLSDISGIDKDLGKLMQNAQQPTTITFNQTNNSPKSLSRMDIYRQTQNQLSMMKGLVRIK